MPPRPWSTAATLTLSALLACAHGPPAAPASPEPPPPPPRPIPAAPAPVAGPTGQPLAPLPARPWSDEVVYAVLVDRFADADGAQFDGLGPGGKGAFHGGDLKGLTARLDELASLGVTALAVSPLAQQVKTFVTPESYAEWPYHGEWPDDFTRLDPRFGSEADLAALVDAAHARGLRVLLDVTYNSAGHQTALLTDPATRGFFRFPCGSTALTACVGNLQDFATERPEVREWLLAAQLPWVARFGLDGLRLLDAASVDHAFWREQRRWLEAWRPGGVFLLGDVAGGGLEPLAPWFAANELDAGAEYAFQGVAVGWASGKDQTAATARSLEARQRVPAGRLLAPVLSSSRVEGALSLLGGDQARFRLAAALQLTVAGLPVILYGEEVGRAGGKVPLNRGDMPWGDRPIRPGAGVPRDEGLRALYQQLLAARKAHPALTRGGHRTLSSQGDLLAFLREDAASGDAVVVVLNRGATAATATFDRPRGWGAAAPAELLGTPLKVDAGRVTVEVPPLGAALVTAGR